MLRQYKVLLVTGKSDPKLFKRTLLQSRSGKNSQGLLIVENGSEASDTRIIIERKGALCCGLSYSCVQKIDMKEADARYSNQLKFDKAAAKYDSYKCRKIKLNVMALLCLQDKFYFTYT